MNKSDRRETILNGVIELLATRGMEGVTHRAVDKIAGLPQGSTTYYYRTKTSLLLAASQHLAELLEKECDELQVGFAKVAAEQGMNAAVDYVAGELVTYVDEARHLFLARMELTLASARRDDLAGVGEKLTAASRQPIEFFLRLISEGKADVPIETCAALIDGISLMYATGQGPKPSADQVAAAFRAVL